MQSQKKLYQNTHDEYMWSVTLYQNTHDEYMWSVSMAVHVLSTVLLCGGISQSTAMRDSSSTMLVCHAWSGEAC